MSKDQSFKNYVIGLEDKYGMKFLYDSNEDKIEQEELNRLDYIPTGSASLDACIGRPGIPRKRITTIYGPPSSSKTALCLSLCKQAIKLGIEVLYVEAELTLDIDLAKAIVGEKDFLEHVTLVQPDTAEQVLGIAGKGIMSGEFGLVIIDSLGDLSPAKEKKEEDFEKRDMALSSSLIGKFLRMYKSHLRQKNIALVLINQVRANIGSYSGGYSLGGGWQLQHDSSIIILTGAGDTIEQGKEEIGKLVKFTIKKSKISKPGKSFMFPNIWGKGIDEARDLVMYATTVGVITTGGPFYKFNGKVIGKGMNAVIEVLENDRELFDQIKLATQTGELPVEEEQKGEVVSE